MNKKFYQAMWLLILFVCSYSFAGLQFYGYQRKEKNDTTVQYIKKRMGSVQLEVSEIHIIPRGCYLDIVEDAWISSNLENLNQPDIMEEFFFDGTISIPPKAAITGMQTWKYDEMFRAQLKASQYTYDIVYSDSSAYMNEVNAHVILLSKLSDSNYKLKLTKVSLGERKHVRIRYLLPNTGGGQAHYTIPVLFNSESGSNPKRCKVTVLADQKKNSYMLDTGIDLGKIRLEDSSSVIVPYRPVIELSYADSVPSVLHLSSFSDGEWQGQYMQLNTSLPGSIIGALSHKMELVFLWRWNSPIEMVTYVDQRKALTPYAYEAIAQAEKMIEVADRLVSRGHAIGLIHTVEGGGKHVFEPSAEGTESYEKLKQYLADFNDQQLYEQYRDIEPQTPQWVPVEIGTESVIESAQNDFVDCLSEAADMFSGAETGFRHIALMSIGDGPVVSENITRRQVDSLISGISFENSNSRWRGVDLNKVIPSVFEQQLEPWYGLYFPSFQPTNINLKVFTDAQPFSFPFKVDSTQNLAITVKTSSPWKTDFHWTGFTSSGKEIGTITTEPVVFKAAQDSGLAKVWAADPDHISENEENMLGATYGIVTKDMYLQASVYDTDDSEENGVRFLNSEEIFRPVSVRKNTSPSGKSFVFRHRINNGILSFTIPQVRSSSGVLRIFDLRGKCIAVINLEQFHFGNGEFRVPLTEVLRNTAHQTVVALIQYGNFAATFTFRSGGRI